MKLLSLFTAASFFLFSTSFSQTTELQKRIQQVENNLIPYVPVKGFAGWKLSDRMKHYGVPGVSIAVIKDYKIDWAKGYGLADTMRKIPVTTETMFSAGSISKLVMAVSAYALVQANRLDLDRPVNDYLSSWRLADNDYTRKTPVTLRMLLSHTGGTSQSSYFGFLPTKSPLPTVVEILSGAPLAETRPVVVNSEPKKEFRYSGGGSMIAQQAIMDVTQQPFADYTNAAVFAPLGMRQSTFAQPLPKQFETNAAWAYSSASWFKGMPYVYPQQAAAGLYTTPTDLAKFFIEVQQAYRDKGSVLSKASATDMLQSQAAVSDGSYKEQICTGPFLLQRTDNTDPRGVYFEFTGVNAGFLAYGIASVEGGNGVVVMLNSGDDVNGLGKEIRRAVAKAYGWYRFLPEEVKPIALTAQQIDSYTGRYRKAVDEVVYISREKNYLVEKINEGGAIYCFPVGRDSIVFTDFNVPGYFGRDENGKVNSLRSAWQQTVMPRMKGDEFSPSEYLNAKNYAAAKEGFRGMKMNEYQVTYIAYELLNKKNKDLRAVQTILELAQEQHPQSAIVFSRWGDYYLAAGDKANAIKSYAKSLELDPSDKQTAEALKALQE